MKDVMKRIVPSVQQRKNFEQVTKFFLKKLERSCIGAKPILGGSGAKDTWLSSSHDIDIFVVFDYAKFSEKSNQLSDLLEKYLKKSFPKLKVTRLHGSRDYFQVKFCDFVFEMVPILKIKKAQDAINITDISPLHSLWVNKKDNRIKNEIRLAKQFFRANRLYGAESYLAGFSGYVLEILIVYYGSFEKLLKASQKWKKQEIIDVEKYYPKGNALFHINRSKTVGPLILVDPVDKTRNAAAALSFEKVELFKKKAKSYLKDKSEDFFVEKTLDLTELAKKKGKKHLVIIEIKVKRGKRDVIGSSLVKAFNYLKRELDIFGLVKSDWEWQKDVIFYFYVKEKELPKFELRKGPPVALKEYAKNFRKKHKNCSVKKDHLEAKIKRKFPVLEDFVKNLLKNDYFKGKIGKVVKVSVTI